VGRAQLRAQLGAFAIAGAPLYVGRHGGEPVTEDYPRKNPYAFHRWHHWAGLPLMLAASPMSIWSEAALMLMRE
jgi:arylsulfatase